MVATLHVQATKVDTSDVTVWCQLASMASLLGNLLLARKSLEQALTCHPSYWPAIEDLCSVLYALGDYSGTYMFMQVMADRMSFRSSQNSMPACDR